MSRVSFAHSQEDSRLIKRIVRRAVQQATQRWSCDEIRDMEMDIAAVHCNGTPLRLRDWLQADDFDFGRDLTGIAKHIDRSTGQLSNHFLPRFAVPESQAVLR